jgi:hypothetical protein
LPKRRSIYNAGSFHPSSLKRTWQSQGQPPRESAEDVEKVNPALIARDREGKPYTVRYDQVNAMLLNEFLKEHRKVEAQEAAIKQLKKDFRFKLAKQQKQIEALTTGLQKVSDQLELSKPALRTVLNNQ